MLHAAALLTSGRSPLLLKDQMHGAGYTNVTREEWSTFSLPEPEQKLAGTGLNAAARQSMHGIVDRGGFEWIKTHQAVDEVADRIQSEIDSGLAQIGFTMYWVIGQKPEK